MQPEKTVYHRRLLCGIVVFSVVGLIITGCSLNRGNQGQGTSHAAVGKKLPAISLDVLTGEGENITAADLTGHVTLLNFWGTWCPPCVQEFPHITALDRQYKNNASFKLISVSMSQSLSPNVPSLRSETQSFLKARNANLTTYVDQDKTTWSGVVNVLDGESGVPTTLILDHNNTIRGVWSGYAPGFEREMQKLVNELLKET